MRITCPNCQAQYDVDDSMIPEAGRDVQCSSCAHTWFVKPAGEDVAEAVPEVEVEVEVEERLPEEVEAEAASDDGADQAETWDEVTPAPADDTELEAAVAEAADGDDSASDEEYDATSEAAEESDAEGETLEDSDQDPDDRFRAAIERVRDDAAERDEGEAFRASVSDADTEDTESETGAMADGAEATGADSTDGSEAKPALDEEVAGILREEAEFEATRRRSEVPPPAFEPQGDLGLDEDRPSDVLRERLDRMRGDSVPEPTIASTVAAAAAASATAEGPAPMGPRRERLPDIEQINSSLRPGEGEEEPELPMSMSELTETRRSGFRTGFTAVVLLVAVLVGAYIFAPQIIRTLPATESAMISYVETANSVRDRIDAVMARAIAGLNGMTGGGSNGV